MWEVGGRRPGAGTAEPEVVPPLAKGVRELQQAGANEASVVPGERLLPDPRPRVVEEYPVCLEGCDEVMPRRARVPPGGVRHIRVVPGEVEHKGAPLAPVREVLVEEGQ